MATSSPGSTVISVSAPFGPARNILPFVMNGMQRLPGNAGFQ
jgi:hypothetical protein